MGYQYDVFLSYLHEPPSGTWVNDHFLGYFRHQLGNALGGQAASIFVDREGIHSGQKWPARLKQALAHSRCLVGIWNPLYFRSEWCLKECAVMRNREQQLGYGTTENPNGLIIGVRVNDGMHFPDYAKISQYGNFNGYYIDGPGFRKTELHAEFQQAIVPLAEDVARIIAKSPVWSPAWLTPPWMEDVIATVKIPEAPNVSQPLLSA